MARMVLYLLGPPRVELDDQPVHIGRSKAMALLAYLAVTGAPDSREALATLLWPESTPSRARANLRRVLVTLRRAMGEEWLDVQPESVALLHPAIGSERVFWLDVNAFQGCLDDCQTHGHPADQPCPECSSLLAEAVALYRDDFLSGFTLPDSLAFDEWAFYESERLRDDVASALQRLVRWHSQQGEVEPAIAYARRWLELDPMHEPAHRQLMALFAQAGRRNAALRQYRTCIRVLEQELAVPPSAETTALYEQIRATREVTPAAPPPPSPTPAPAALPAFLSTAAPPAVVETPVFVARERELERLQAFLADALTGRGKVAFIAGGPGRGKTALMREFAWRAVDARPDLLVASGACNAFSGVGDPYLPFREILAMLTGAAEAPWAAGAISRQGAQRLWAATPLAAQALLDHGPYLIDALVSGPELLSRATAAVADDGALLEVLRGWVERERPAHTDMEQRAIFEQYTNVLCALAAQQPLLLTLDDLQWADDGSIGLLFHLGRRLQAERIVIVCAYRPEEIAIERDGEHHPLQKVLAEFGRQFGDVWLDLTAADQAEGYRLVKAFLDTEPNLLGVDFRNALYQRTGGHPLFTVELLRTMQIRGDLVKDEADAWVEGPALDWETLPARVEAVIKARVDRLGDALRDLLAVASVEGERFTAQVVAAIQGLPEREVLRAFYQELGARHRLVRERDEVQIDGRFLSRYQFAHALFQEHLYNNLSAGERRLLHGEVGAALETLYGARADEIAAQLAHHYTLAGQRDKAVKYALHAGDNARQAYANAEAIRYYAQVLQWLDAARKDAVARERRLAALRGLGQIHLGMGTVAEAEGYLRQAIALGKEMGLPARELVHLYFWLADVLYWRGRLDEEIRVGEEGLAVLAADASPASAVGSLEWVLMQHHVAVGRRYLEDSKSFCELTQPVAAVLDRLPYVPELRAIYTVVMEACAIDQDVQGALQWSKKLQERAAAIHDLRGVAAGHLMAGGYLLSTGDLTGAISRYHCGLELFTTIGDVKHQTQCLFLLAECLCSLGDLPRAQETAQRALKAARSVELKGTFVWTEALRVQGTIFAAQAEWEKAVGAYRDALRVTPGGSSIHLALPMIGLGWALLAVGDADGARKHLEGAIAQIGPQMFQSDPALLAGLLGGLDRAYADAAAFRAFCHRLREQHPELRASRLMQWDLEPATVRMPRGPALQHDPFVDALSAEWTWHDPFGDCSLVVDAGLEIHAANARGLGGMNWGAPRVLRPASGAWAAQTVCRVASEEQLALGGLLLWKDEHNFLRLESSPGSAHEIFLTGCLQREDACIGRGRLSAQAPRRVFLRLERSASRVRALCSADGEEWFTVGAVEFSPRDPLQVGLYANGNIHRVRFPGAHPDGTAIRFESFTLWSSDR